MRKFNSNFINSMNFKSIAKKASAGFLAALIAMGGSPVYANGGDKDKKPKSNIDAKSLNKFKKLYKDKMDDISATSIILKAKQCLLGLKGADRNLTNTDAVMDRVFDYGNNEIYVKEIMDIGTENEDIVGDCKELFESIDECYKLLYVMYNKEQKDIPKKGLSIKLLLVHEIGTLHRLIEILRARRKPCVRQVYTLDFWLRLYNLEYIIAALREYVECELKAAFNYCVLDRDKV